MYCLRSLIQRSIPLNDGVINALDIRIPESILAPPWHSDPRCRHAMAGGNVETSQRICDVIFGALNAVAASQGTMNNVSFGTPVGSYYETIGGGSGAGPGFNGANGVQVHMTNTRITDPEIIERQFGIEITRFAFRRDSGGTGRFRGGDGLVRVYRFTDDVDVSILSERRGQYPPFGCAGGSPGKTGQNILIRAGGSREDLPGKVDLRVHPGDILIIETPGGGGWEKP
jgi:5-oxoprolinase (ATP-hydrolysing)